MKSIGAPRRTSASLISVLLGGALVTGCTQSGVTGSSGGSSTGGSTSGGASSLPSGKYATVDAYYAQQIKWTPCTNPPAEDPEVDLSPYQCGTYDVPLDYTKPNGPSVPIALVKWPAADPSTKVGSLLTNPGGPGASGVDFVEEAKQQFDGALHAHFDIIGFDPRGLGRSDPIKCESDKDQDKLYQQDAPKDPTARQAKNEKDSKDLATACEKNSGALLPFMGSKNVAKDMDVLRQVLGDKQLNYLGISYGTYIGSVYAEQFPAKVGRLVLDGAVDPNADQLEADVQQQIGFEKSLDKFAQDCVTNHASECPLGSDPKTAPAKLGAFIDGLRDHPLHTSDPGGRKLDQGLGWTGVIIGLYGDVNSSWWEYLRQGLTAAMQNGDGTILLRGSDQYNGRDPKGHYSTEQDGLIAVRCADFNTPAPTPDQVTKAYDETKAGAPVLNADLQPADLALSICSNWPFQTPEKPHPIRADGSAPILVVGTTDDPATPYQNAVNLAKGFANARLLTRVGTGHAAFGSGNACAQKAMEDYLDSGTLPAVGTRCTS